MSDHELLIRHIQTKVSLTDNELDFFLARFKLTKVKKRQFIVQPGFISRHRNFVLEGAFRSYVVGDEGQDHTIMFAIEDWWITDYVSYFSQQRATMFVMALENSTILQLDYDKEQELKKASHKFETYFRILAEHAQASHYRRLISNLTEPAEQRFEEFAEKYAHILQRVPQYALASYLGITTEYLSKLRNKRVLKKS